MNKVDVITHAGYTSVVVWGCGVDFLSVPTYIINVFHYNLNVSIYFYFFPLIVLKFILSLGFIPAMAVSRPS